MQLITSNGKAYAVDWADTAMRTGELLFEMPDERRLPDLDLYPWSLFSSDDYEL